MAHIPPRYWEAVWLDEQLAPKDPRKHAHDDLQAAVMEFLHRALPDNALAHHSPGEGKRGKRAQAELARSGYVKGWPDIEIIWKQQTHPMLIELKATKNDPFRPSQRETHRRLEYCGAKTAVCRSVPEVEAQLRAWGVPLRATVMA